MFVTRNEQLFPGRESVVNLNGLLKVVKPLPDDQVVLGKVTVQRANHEVGVSLPRTSAHIVLECVREGS